MGQNELEQLHEKASTHYLQGEYRAARDAWTALLEDDPEDERALEGIRLCEQLEAEQPAHAEEPVETADPGSVSRSLTDSLAELDGNESEEEAFPAADETGADLLDLSELSDFADVAVDEAVPTIGAEPEEPLGFDLAPDEDEGEADPIHEPPAATDDPSDAIRARIQECMSLALAALESGSNDTALAHLDDLLSLDPENASAQSMRDRLIAQTATDAPPQLDARDQDFIGEPLEEPLPLEPLPDALPLEPLPAPDFEAEPLEEPEPASERPRARIAAPEPLVAAKPPRTMARNLGLVVLLLAILGGGGYAYQSGLLPFGPAPEVAETPGSEAAPVASTTEPAEVAAAVAPENEEGEKAPASDVATPIEASSTERLAKALAHARKVFDSGRYSQAVMAYDAVLKIDPAHPEATRRIREAGAMFREKQRERQQWQAAIDSFNTGDYETALRLFYRFPEGYHAEIERYKFNGWFNRGLQALRAQNCVDARQNVDEARQIDPKNSALPVIEGLAKECSARKQAPTYLISLDTLSYRALRD